MAITKNRQIFFLQASEEQVLEGMAAALKDLYMRVHLSKPES
jgi:hypothetical protein